MVTKRLSPTAFLAISAAFLTGYMPTFSAPWLIGQLSTEYGFNASKSSLLLSLEFIGIATAGFITAAFYERISPVRLALLGACMAFCAHLLSMVVEDFNVLAIIRIIAGLSAGVTLAVSSSSASAYENPDRIFGLLLIVMGIGSAIGQYACGYLSVAYGIQGLYGMLAAYALIAIPFISQLPDSIDHQAYITDDKGKAVFLVGSLTVVASIFFTISQMGAWTFMERLGTAVGLNVDSMSSILAIGQILGLAGGAAAAYINIKYGRVGPLVIGIGLNAISIFLLYTILDVTTYTLAFFVFNSMWYFCLPYYLGTASLLDETGQWAAATSAGSLFGIAFGPIGFGIVYDKYGFGSLGLTGLIVSIVSLFAILGVVYWAKSHAMSTQ